MRRLFLPPGSLEAETVTITGSDFHHLAHVLRARIGEEIRLLDGDGKSVDVVIERISKADLFARSLRAAPLPPDPPVHVTIAQSIGKGDKLEQVIQHCTEMGASAFIPLLAQRSTVKVDSKSIPEKLARWRLVAKGAAEQSGRARIPDVLPPASVSNLSGRLPDSDSALILDRSGPPLNLVLGELRHVEQPRYLLLAGPEGGYTNEELEQTVAAGAKAVSLGPFTLRTETAALAALSQLMFRHYGGS